MARVLFIKAAQRIGFTLDEIAQLLQLDDGTQCSQARAIAEHKLAGVRQPGRHGKLPADRRAAAGRIIPGGAVKHSLSLMTDDGKVLPRLKAALISLALLTMAGCASVPKVDPPDPTQLDAAGQVRHFQGVTPDQVLAAAETVLRKHRPEASFTHESGTLAMEYEGRFFYVLLGGYELERWGVAVRALGDVTAASVAMGYATDGYAGTFAGPGVEFPHPTGGYGRAVDIDYGMFWKRMGSVLKGEPWPECEQARREPGYRYYEPLCQHMMINRSETK